MFNRVVAMVLVLLWVWSGQSIAQSLFIESDTLLFRLPSGLNNNIYSEATRYYRAEGAKRRGVNYWTLNELLEPFPSADIDLELSESQLSASIYATYGEYRYRGVVSYIDNFSSGWGVESRFDFKTGRDASIDGVFRNEAKADISLSRDYGVGHYLALDLDFDYIIRSSQGTSTKEAFDLTSDNFYNPYWGYYNGEVRNARVNSYFTPEFGLRYQRPVLQGQMLALDADLSVGELKRGSLGYYNAFNPYPDYYKKLPSAMDYGYVRDYTTAVWQSGDSDYTQIAWDELEGYNLASQDGAAYYIVESKVERYVDTHLLGVVKSTPLKGVTIEWGVEGDVDYSLNYKQVDDLLGADYHLDMDYLIGDSYNISNQMQNNLLDPDRKVVEGDRFGYNYSLRSGEISAVAALTASFNRFDLSASASVGSGSIQRGGHYEKERFPGSSSYGESSVWSYTPLDIRGEMSYSIGAMHSIRLAALYMQSAPYIYDIFLDIEDANTLAGTSPQRTADLSLGYQFTRGSLTLDCSLYATLSRDLTDITANYDDLTDVMCRAVSDGIDTNSFGVEVVMDWDISSAWQWITTLTASSYRYASNPDVTLYSDINFSVVAAASPALIKGLIVGNAPQFTTTSSLSYKGFRRTIINLNTSLSAMRYIEPSMIRRTQRVCNHTANLSSDIVAYSQQERLDDIFDVGLSVIRFFFLSNGDRVMVRVAATNLLGDNDRVVWASESNRLTSYDEDGLSITWQGQGSRYRYGSARSIYISLGYNF